ncbi:MAG TPA: hypothetical protein VMT57_08970 [Candidatus Thermoplasmatota archaeon]|nr:hypothetical protein [Candidatus Thermoplasmatota archaeon]
MKTATLLIGLLLVICCFLGNVRAQFTTVQGTLHGSTDVLFSGETNINATFTGFPMDRIVDSPLVKDMNAFILPGGNTIRSLSTVIVVEDIDITQVDSLEDLYSHYTDHIRQFTNAALTTDTGFFLLGYPSGGTISVHTDVPYAVSTSHTLTLNQSLLPCDFLATQTPVVLSFSGDYAVLAQPLMSAVIRLNDQSGKTLWTGNSSSNYLILKDQHFQITQHPPLAIFPLNQKESTVPMLSYTLAPADQNKIHLQELLESVSTTAAHLAVMNVSEMLKEIQRYNLIISNAKFLANGAIILNNSNDTINLDDTTQTVKGFGLIHVHDLTVTYEEPGIGPTIQGTYSLAFLGDHFYNPQAGSTDNGIAFPYLLLIVWIVALAFFLYIRFLLKPPVDSKRDSTLKRYALLIHIILLMVAFLFLDLEVNAQLGISTVTSLIAQGSIMITGLCLGLELLLGVLSYLLLVLPVRLILISGLRILHIGKGGRGLGAGIADLMIGVFAAFYLFLFLNMIISVLHLQGLFTTG